MSYKIGDTIASKYRVTSDFDSAGGGTCQWGFAIYESTEYFVKKFLTPVYPGLKASGSEEKKQKRREQCYEFEAKHKAIQDALCVCGEGGLVVKTIDFFREGNDYGEHYLKVCQKIDTSSLSNQIYTLEAKDRLLIMLTAAYALNILHLRGIIHLDLKPDNILIQKHDGKHIAKIIDFDSSVLEEEPISSEFLVGDQIYYSPEVAQYITTNSETSMPNKKSDIFSLGLIFCQYWTGKLPIFSTYTYPYEAVINTEKLKIPEIENFYVKSEEVKNYRLKGTLIQSKSSKKTGMEVRKNPTESAIEQLIYSMLMKKPEERPSASEVHQKLKEIQIKCAEENDLTPSRVINSKKKSTPEHSETSLNYWYKCHFCTNEGEFFSEDISQCQGCGSYEISIKQDYILYWLTELKKRKQTVLVKITGANKGGLLVDIQGKRGFIPKSHVAEVEDLKKLINRSLIVSILEVDPHDILLSQRQAKCLEKLDTLKQGQLVEGKITAIRDFGVLINIGSIKALLYISEISQKFVTDLSSLFKIGQPIKAVILNIDEDKLQVSLSTKVLENYPGEMLNMMDIVMAEAEARSHEIKA